MTEGYWFRSAAFEIEPGEDSEVNPGIYGRQLAHWLGAQFSTRGWRDVDVFAEDFGWCVNCQSGPVRLWVGCANVDDAARAEGVPDGRDVVWHCFPVVEGSMLARLFRKRALDAELERLDTVLRGILQGSAEIEFVEAP